MAGKYYFLCEFFNKRMFLYGIKSSLTNWHYFEDKDCLSNSHVSLPTDLWNQIILLKKLQEVAVDLV